MARLYDKVRAGLFRAPTVWHTDKLEDAIRRAQVIVADNVAEYYFAGTDQEVWHLRDDFPNLAPPFDAMWLETRRPSKVVSEVHGTIPSTNLPRAWGMLLFSADLGEGEPRRWLSNALLWMSPDRGRGLADVYGPIGAYLYFVGEDGRPVRGGDGNFVMVVGLGDSNDPSKPFLMGTEQEHGEVVIQLVHPLLLALSFMHCKNVARREVVQPPTLSKKWAKKHGRPLVRYHVLDIDPMKKVLREEGGADHTGIKRALHICRGHFATYTDEAPLFGRTTGTFWKSQHVRGSLSEGAVVKDYNVKAPKPKERGR